MAELRKRDTKEAEEIKEEVSAKKELSELNYYIDETPPWYLCILLGLQHYLTMFGSTVAVPLILAAPMCYDNSPLAKSEIISTIFFVSGLCTLIQTILGNRLPIVQGATFAFLAPTGAILNLYGECPAQTGNLTAAEYDEISWKPRMREIQGAIMVASLFQILIGFTGMVGFLLRFIGPLTIAPTVTLVGLALFGAAANFSGVHWGISAMTIVLIIMFSQYLRNIEFPVPSYERGRGCFAGKLAIFRLFPIIMAIVISWVVCVIITASGGFPSSPTNSQYMARTDARIDVLNKAKWFRFPYPGQWGTPTVSMAGVFGMLAGVLASMIESIGDYFACARLSGAPPPPTHAVNRGIGVEGIGCLLAGAWGSGNGTTSYSENIGAIGITKVASRRVVQAAAIVMLVLACLGKFGALFVTIPDPIVGGVFMVMFGMITAVGISNLQFVDMNSSRNLFVFGFSMMLGMALPSWMQSNSGVIQTGYRELDQIITVLLSTNMFVAGFVGCILDNTVPGTPEERGMVLWKKQLDDGESTRGKTTVHTYDLPCGLKRLSRFTACKYIPFLPYYPKEYNHPETGRQNGIDEKEMTSF
ncbi:predicted protein [Nematostella vectensis]|uniref:Solute carrier family 23 member 2 n=1 Tax=Nematostella vectensis TaxID=45351 RepID=A7RY77_NEMVE|nr:solute carrier family 23 member 2 [Nematostella vectensis]EDO43651.1 predicted protein [Nematostella vectensis]|eukprot:XP_001635714.1 predicted protein [Nematostella vectensis]